MGNIIKLKPEQKEAILSYIMAEPEMNLFFIGDIENFGIDSEEVDIFALGSEASFECLILRYLDYYLVYAQKETYDAKSVADFLKQRKVACISGKYAIIVPLTEWFPHKKITRTYLSRCNLAKEFSLLQDVPVTIRKLTPEDAKAMIDLFLLIDEFAESYRGKESEMIQETKLNLKKGGNGVGAFYGEQLVAVAETTAENSLGAMITGVCTHPDWRKKGIASAVVSKLCHSSLEKGLGFLCLFYHNPDAGKIYQKIGFVEMGEYALFR